MNADALAIFVGGAATRMHGRAKGLLLDAQGEPIVAKLVRFGRALGLEPVLVGRADRTAIYELPDVRRVDDPAEGPVAALRALAQAMPDRSAVVVGCDMPHLTQPLLERLARAPGDAVVLAPKSAARKWEPFFSRVRLRALANARPERSLQALFDALGAQELALSPDELAQLRDWDTPEDVARDQRQV